MDILTERAAALFGVTREQVTQNHRHAAREHIRLRIHQGGDAWREEFEWWNREPVLTELYRLGVLPHGAQPQP